MTRKRFEWRLRNRSVLLGERTLIMAALNVTPDSFSDGGRYSDPDRAFARAIELEEQGADILDIGGESTRPRSQRISEAEELRRVVPILKRLRGKLTIPISVDTYKSAVAEKALELGVEIVNDPSALTFDPALAKTAAQYNAGLILNHMRGTPETWEKLPPMKDVASGIGADLEATVHRAVRAGVERTRIAVDPGLGFGKRREQNSEILGRLPALARLDLPLVVGPSRKLFLSQWSKAADEVEMECATAAAVAAAILGGAHIVRVHDVRVLRNAIGLADQILETTDAAELAREAEPPRPRVQRPYSPRR